MEKLCTAAPLTRDFVQHFAMMRDLSPLNPRQTYRPDGVSIRVADAVLSETLAADAAPFSTVFISSVVCDVAATWRTRSTIPEAAKAVVSCTSPHMASSAAASSYLAEIHKCRRIGCRYAHTLAQPGDSIAARSQIWVLRDHLEYLSQLRLAALACE